MLKRTKMFAGVVRIKLTRQELKHETELSKNLGFIVTLRRLILNASATVLRTACKRKASEHVMERVTTNGTESYHGHLNAEFNAPQWPHPNIYIFVEILLRQQAATYVTVSSHSKSRTIPRSIREKSARLRELFTDSRLD